jgi:prephenate dehydrogenase
MQIAIIGAGAMGSWFAKHFKERGVQVIIFDIDPDKAKETAKSLGIKFASSVDDVLDSEIFLICVNISKTPQVVKEIGMRLSKSQTLVEIASLKNKVAQELEKLECNVLSIHPLFGPGAETIEGQNIAVITDLSDDQAKEKLLPLLTGANITECNLEEHEKSMAIVLSLPFAMNLVFIDFAKQVPEALQGSTFLAQLSIANKVAQEQDDLKRELLNNEYLKKVIDEYIKKMKSNYPG